MKVIEIKNVKHIKKLTFEIPKPGLHLLAGRNGAGKTSLLAALHRIGLSTAFPLYFRPSAKSDILDNFDKSEISYSTKNRTVTYSYAGERWVPRPRANSDLLDGFGYPEVLYIGATADRLTPRGEDFEVRRIGMASHEDRDAANIIFNTQKFDGLRVINLTRGTGNQAFLLQATPPPKATYYSEKNFSLGELCVLKMLRRLRGCKKNALILIDELELALHPRAQVELLNHLKRIAGEKNLTIIFSTHSITLLRQVPRKDIIFLENYEDEIKAAKDIYPGYAIGHISIMGDALADVILYSEDEAGASITKRLVNLFINEKYPNEHFRHPEVQVVPIGPFMSVVRHLPASDAILDRSIKTFAILDADVKDETLASWEKSKNHALLEEFQKKKDRIHYLPWTPEVGVINFLNEPGAELKVQRHFGCRNFQINKDFLKNYPKDAGGEQRKFCKLLLGKISADLSALKVGLSKEDAKNGLFHLFAEHYFSKEKTFCMQFIGKIL